MKTGTLIVCSVALTMSACAATNHGYDHSHTGYASQTIAHNDCTQVYKHSVQHPLCLPVVSSYAVMFVSGSVHITPEGHKVLDQAIDEVDKYNPRQVTVSGFPDSSNYSGFDKDLANQREKAIANALIERGMHKNILGGVALEETRKAIKTLSGMQNLDNRHVVIDFRR